VLTVQRPTGWNPFQLPDTPENRTYLIELLSLMRTCYGGAVSPDDMERFHAAIEENYGLLLPERRLRHIAWCFGQGDLHKAMRLWYGDGANAGCFDNETDNIDLSQCRHYCYEMGELIRDGAARPELAVVLSYPFHRIAQAMNGEPFILVLEEGQNLVTHAYWRDKIDAYLMQIRRKNGIVIFVTPDPKYLYCETDSIKKQAVTQLYLPNSNAVRRDYVDELGRTQAQYEFIRDTPPESRKLLICRGRESVKAVFDLSDIPEVIPVLSSNEKGVRLMHDILEELKTDDPQIWVPVFMARALATGTHNISVKQRRAA
jgi:type IV secretion system protein VirB4